MSEKVDGSKNNKIKKHVMENETRIKINQILVLIDLCRWVKTLIARKILGFRNKSVIK